MINIWKNKCITFFLNTLYMHCIALTETHAEIRDFEVCKTNKIVIKYRQQFGFPPNWQCWYLQLELDCDSSK